MKLPNQFLHVVTVTIQNNCQWTSETEVASIQKHIFSTLRRYSIRKSLRVGGLPILSRDNHKKMLRCIPDIITRNSPVFAMRQVALSTHRKIYGQCRAALSSFRCLQPINTTADFVNY